MELGGQHHAPAAFNPENTRYPLYRRLGGASEPAWIGAENLALSGIRFPDLPGRSESLYRLCHPGFLDIRLGIYFNENISSEYSSLCAYTR